MARLSIVLCFSVLMFLGTSYAASDVNDLKNQVEQLRKEISKNEDGKSFGSGVTDGLRDRYGPNAPVTTKNGKLQIGGLVQVWYQSIQNDNSGIVRPAAANGLAGTNGEESNETSDNDTFRIRRTELRFSLDIHENITAYMMIDPSREHNVTFTPIPTFPTHNEIFNTTNVTAPGAQTIHVGSGNVPSLLQDAYINFHGVVPHHDFTIGQFKPPAGEEAWRNSGQLEFVERAMVTGINNVRDIGAMVHGTWVDGRVQYWLGAFNGPDGTVLADPEIAEGGNRSDDNDDKDIAWRVATRPVWNPECWYGRLELGYARTDGFRGEAGNTFDVASSINGSNQTRTAINRQSAWAWYRPGGPVKGWWLRGEWGSGHDRYSGHGQSTRLLALGGSGFVFGDGSAFQANPTPVTVSGWYFGTGYKMSDTIFSEGLSKGGSLGRFLNDLEFAFRYEVYENIAAEDLVQPDRHTDLFKTQAYTFGVNYYINGIKNHNAKIQANYIVVDEPSDGNPDRGLREVRNNVFVVNFQLMF